MTVRMTLPPFVTRAAARIALGGVIAAAAIAGAALVMERTALGGDLAESRARLRAEVEGEFAELARRLDQAVRAVGLDPDMVRRAERGDTTATRQLFDLVAASGVESNVSVTVYGAANQPVAWLGRSEDVPEARLSGPASTFLAQSSQGLQLVRVQPIVDPSEPARHIGAVVAEAPLPRTGETLAGSEFALETSIVPVALRLQFEGAADAGPDAFVIRSPTNEPLAAAVISDDDLGAARRRIRDRLYAAELALAALLVLLAAGPLLDWRRLARSTALATVLTVVIAVDLISARAILWIAIRKAGLADLSLLPSAPLTPLAALMFASPIDFFLNALVIAGLVVLAVSSFSMWRSAHRPGIGVVIVDRPARAALFYAVQLAAGFSVTALVMAYEWLLRTHVSQTPVEIVRFSLGRIELSRLPVIVGLIALNAAIVGLAILLYRLAWSPWAFPDRHRSWRVHATIRVAAAGGPVLRCVCGKRSRAALAVAAGRDVRGGCRVADAALSLGGSTWLTGDQAPAVVPGRGAAVDCALPLAGRCVRAGASPTDRNPIRAGSHQSAAGTSLQAAEGACRDQPHRRARRSGAGQRSAGVRPAVNRRRVSRLVPDQPRHRTPDLERRTAQRIGCDGQPVCDEPAGLHAAAAMERAVVRLGDSSTRSRRCFQKNAG